MKTIILSTGETVLVDAETYEWARNKKWQLHTDGYAHRGARRSDGRLTTVKMHREILGALPGQLVDHVNGNKLDNRKENLRFCSKTENGWNRPEQKNNTSGYKGVYATPYGRWTAQTRLNKKLVYLGTFATKEEAAEAYNQAALKHHGPFAKLNKVSR